MKREVPDEGLGRELRAAIEQYHQFAQNDHGHAVLDRLLDQPDRVLPAFEAVSRDRWPNLLYACLRACQEQRRHKDVIEQAKLDVEAASKAEEALGRVRKWLDRELALSIKVPACDVMAFPLMDSSSSLGPIEGGRTTDYRRDDRQGRAAIDLLMGQIIAARRRAKDELLLRSQKGEAGSRAGAVGWIKAAIRHSSGAQNWRRVVADLATAVLGEEVFEDAVRHAKTPQEWQGHKRGPGVFRPQKSQ